MTQNCTIYSLSESAIDLVDSIKKIAPKETLTINGGNDNWSTVEYTSNEASMIVNRMVSVTLDDEFTTLVTSTHGFVQQITSKNTETQNELLNVIQSSKQILGIAADPQFDECAEDIVFALVGCGKSVIFTGNTFLNSEGGLILDVEGNSEEGVEV